MPAEPSAATSAHVTTQTTLIPAITAWKYYLEDQGRSTHTVKAFAADALLLAAYLPPDRAVGAISTLDLNHFLHWLQTGRGVPCSPKSLARRITSIKAFFRWLHQYGVMTVDPAEKVLQQTVISPLPEVLTPEETQTALTVAAGYRKAKKPDARAYVLLALLLETGIKKGECLAINPNHLELESENGPFLFVRYPTQRNRYKERKIALSADWVAAYREYAAQYPQADQVFPWSQRRLEYLLEEIGQESGLTKHLSFDMCRWTCAINDYRAGVEPEQLRQKLGISKIQWREVSLKLRNLSGQNETGEKAETPTAAAE